MSSKAKETRNALAQLSAARNKHGEATARGFRIRARYPKQYDCLRMRLVATCVPVPLLAHVVSGITAPDHTGRAAAPAMRWQASSPLATTSPYLLALPNPLSMCSFPHPPATAFTRLV